MGKSKPTGVEGLSWTILRSRREDSHDIDIDTMVEHHSKLWVALNVLHECFQPFIEPRTKADFFTNVVFNRGVKYALEGSFNKVIERKIFSKKKREMMANIMLKSKLKRLNFQGFYTMILEKEEEVISVATVRIFGEKVAEVPLIGTRVQYRRLGMCRLLMNEIEKPILPIESSVTIVDVKVVGPTSHLSSYKMQPHHRYRRRRPGNEWACEDDYSNGLSWKKGCRFSNAMARRGWPAGPSKKSLGKLAIGNNPPVVTAFLLGFGESFFEEKQTTPHLLPIYVAAMARACKHGQLCWITAAIRLCSTVWPTSHRTRAEGKAQDGSCETNEAVDCDRVNSFSEVINRRIPSDDIPEHPLNGKVGTREEPSVHSCDSNYFAGPMLLAKDCGQAKQNKMIPSVAMNDSGINRNDTCGFAKVAPPVDMDKKPNTLGLKSYLTRAAARRRVAKTAS
ncbi:hypothetical protein ACLOJK_018435 [Asimina triloba]